MKKNDFSDCCLMPALQFSSYVMVRTN